ncbi:MAG: Uma2 family endonuclease [Raineya sp.]|nr:Uma2 family endonuclease [Raineya sp.]
MKTITSLSELDLNGIYTYADYLSWRLEQAVELIKGKIFPMSPAPSMKHQRVSMFLSASIFNFLQNTQKACQVFSAPFDVRLLDKKKSKKANQVIYTVVQPDICIICDKSKLDDKGCLGAPDLVVEILSLGNSKKEMKIKYQLYEETGVKEYWVVFPYEQNVLQFVLDEKTEKFYLKTTFSEDEILTSHIFPDLQINLAKVFEE